MPVARFHSTDVTLDYDGTLLRVWSADPDALGDVHCVLAHAGDAELEGPLVGMFAVHSSLAHTLPGKLSTYAQHAVDRL